MNGVKKHRGLKRYYKNLSTENDLDKATWLDFDNPETWFDNWHLHFDWKGYGNDSFKRRKPHLDKLFRHFDLLVNKTKIMQHIAKLQISINLKQSNNSSLIRLKALLPLPINKMLNTSCLKDARYFYA